ncbi:hypothetical protein JVU11DRAFT_8800 [Chiua virens]|nr:hypothetical protein JVU11DRAFT_8800 [Chiua virens]
MATTKLLSLLLMTNGIQYALTAPNVRPPTEQLRELRDFEYATPYILRSSKVITWTWMFLECSALIALSGLCPQFLARPILHFLVPTSVDPTTVTTLTPITLGGCLLSLSGALLRAHCFHVLGSRFTFELSIRPAHTLVTDGVYGVVRHPSYTGMLTMAVGWMLCVLDPHSLCMRWAWATMEGSSGDIIGTTGVDGVGTTSLVCVGATILGVLYAMTNKRMNKEDAMLEKSFGNAWRSWAERVPYRLIPGVI